jgi:small subunit ribosomal protein S17
MATQTAQAATEKEFRSARKTLVGVVASAKMDKTRVVVTSWQSTHAKYGKVLHRSSRFYAHDEKNESQLGDKVEITETRPMSKLKRWRIVRIVGKAA